MLFIIYLLHYQRVAVGGGECTCELVFVRFKSFGCRHAQPKKIARNVETGNCQKKMQSKFRLVNAVDLNFPAVINESSSSNNNKAKKK